MNLHHAKDTAIFQAARAANAVLLTKDADFLQWLAKFGAPPKVVWITCGNTSNQHLRRILRPALGPTLDMLQAGESMVEITGTAPRPERQS